MYGAYHYFLGPDLQNKCILLFVPHSSRVCQPVYLVMISTAYSRHY